MRHALISTRGLIEADRDADIHGKPRVELPLLPSVQGAAPPPPSPPLAEAVARYKADRIATGTWGEKTASDNRGHLDRFAASLGGDREVGSVTRDDIRTWRDSLQLGQGTLRLRVQIVSAFLRWCVAEGHVEKNVASGLAPKELSKRDSGARVAYTSVDLRLLFGPAFTAMRSKRADHFWVPLMALLSGARVSELCQLAVDDIAKKSGVHCIEIRARREGQSLKNEASERLVPLHSHLLTLGFAEYVKERRATGEPWLFAHCRPSHDGRGMGAPMSTWWPTWVKRFDGISPNTALHSFRHGVSQVLTAKDVPEVVTAQLLGHKNKSITTGRYGTRLNVCQLSDAIEKLDFSAEVDALQSFTAS